MRCAFGVCDRIAMVAEERFAFIGTPKWFLETDEPEVRAFIDALPPDYPPRLRWVLLASADPLFRAAQLSRQ